MITVVPAERLFTGSSKTTSGVCQQSLATGSVSAVRSTPGIPQHVRRCTPRTQPIRQASNAPFIGGSNAQPAVQVSVDSIKVKLQDEIKDTKRGIFGIKASAYVLASEVGAIAMPHGL